MSEGSGANEAGGEDGARVAVVTGAGQGIGEGVAVALARTGVVVVVSDIDGSAAEAVAARIISSGGRASAVAADVASEADVVGLAEAAEARHGPLDTWVNNAGLTRPAMLHKMELADFEQVLKVHAVGTFLGTREAARRMLASGERGCILNVTSAAGLQGTIGQVNYAAAKGAIVSITTSAARELARYGIRVNAVAPVAATPMTEKVRTDEKLSARYLANIPLGRFAEPDEVAGMFVHLASPESSYVTGQVVCIDGGLYMAS